jgi:uncharacterized protein YbjQ (UPF0145 family)
MGMCKECNEVFNANDMINGLCKSCMPEGYLQEKEEEKSRVKEFDENKQKKLDSILVTTETFIDLPIEKRIDIASAQCVYGLNIIKDLFTGIRNIVGGRIKSIEDPLDEARQEIINTLKVKTYLAGGNAIIGIKIEHTYNNAGAANMVSMFGTGTMVKLKD